ncbi:hypothetical protein [Variovorax sp. KK3]|uniref:hypothetical protein n=1 Tax=Variovorax sp. KK3 TaxID=1855728 RepID=UPI00097C97DA|nr:hypothetical protein [Variovorax sp. KK3]
MAKRNLAIVFACMVVGSALWWVDRNRADWRQARRAAEQADLLVSLEALNRASVLAFVRHWKAIYAQPDDERLEKLRSIVARLQRDPTALETF